MRDTTKYVRLVLEEIPATRDSDDLCYLHTLRAMGVDVNEVSVTEFFVSRPKRIPTYETVGRVRRLIQAECEELRGTPRIRALRRERAEAVKAWAVNHG